MTKKEIKKSRYLEILIPEIKISRTSGCLVIFIPSKIAKKHEIKHKDKITPTLFLNDEDVNSKYKQIALPLIEVSKTAGSLVIFIPRYFAKKHEIKYNNKYMLMIMKRRVQMYSKSLNEITKATKEEEREMDRVLRELEAHS